MKFLKSLLFCLFALLAFSADAQVKGSGVQYFNTVAQMNGYIPDVTSGSEIAIVTSASVVATIYTWDRVNTQWAEITSITVSDTDNIELSIVNGVLTATFAGNGATSGQTYFYNGTAWVPRTITGSDVVITPTGNYTGSDVQAALNNIAGQLHDAATLGSGNSTALTLTGQALKLDEDVLESNLAVNDLKTLTGVASGAVNLGTFTGSVIADNSTIKEALQSLEGLSSNAVTATPTQYYDDAAAAAGGVGAGQFYELALSNRYGGVRGTIRRRQ